tara:strand:- start:1036 stop:1914 length:879 start_codon:yes stop_codon:yes gene_type:complete
MKKIFISLIILFPLLITQVSASKFNYQVGSVVESEVIFGKKDKFPLPPGKFKVAVIHRKNEFKDIMLYQVDKNNTLIWAIQLYATGNTEWHWWNAPKFCERTNVYFIKKKKGNKKYACWMVNHSRSNIGANKGFWKKVRDYEIARNINMPDILVYASWEYSKGPKVWGTNYYYNPEQDGVPKPKNLEWDTNEFHIQKIKNNPKHEEFLNKFVSISASFIDQLNKNFKIKGGLTLNPQENFSQASINMEKKEDKKSSDSNTNIVEKIEDLKELLDAGAITKEEFEKAKKKLLN